jgi:hypothetical protein
MALPFLHVSIREHAPGEIGEIQIKLACINSFLMEREIIL